MRRFFVCLAAMIPLLLAAMGAIAQTPCPVLSNSCQAQTVSVTTTGSVLTVPATQQLGMVGFQFTGLTTSTAALSIEVSNDGGATYYPIATLNGVTSISSDGHYEVAAAAHTNLAVFVTRAGTGTVTASYALSNQAPPQATSGPAVPCQGGSGSVISSVSTTVTTVCSAGTTRGYATVVANSGVSGNVVAVGTFDGTTPTASHYDFVLYGGIGWDTTGMGTVPTGPIQVLSLGGTVTLTASAIQTGAAP